LIASIDFCVNRGMNVKDKGNYVGSINTLQ